MSVVGSATGSRSVDDGVAGNQLLAFLPPEERALVSARLEPVSLPYGYVVQDVYTPIDHVYFPDDAVVSSVSVMTDRSVIETATIGREGMTGLSVFHGVRATPEHVFVQVPGRARRVRVAEFLELLPGAPTLRALLHRYSSALFTLAGQNSGCNRKHSMVQRCARWMLMTHDRVGRDTFELTHLVLSQMLGVRRASVTVAALALQRAGAIEYSRGRVRVSDRARLEAAACECYGIISSTFDRTLWGLATPSPLDWIRLADGTRSVARDGTPDAENDPGVLPVVDVAAEDSAGPAS